MIELTQPPSAFANDAQAAHISGLLTPDLLLSPAGDAFTITALDFLRDHREGRATQSNYADAWTLYADWRGESETT